MTLKGRGLLAPIQALLRRFYIFFCPLLHDLVQTSQETRHAGFRHTETDGESPILGLADAFFACFPVS